MLTCTSLPPEIGLLQGLRNFYVVSGNPLSDLPDEVVAGGDAAVLQWLRDQAKK